MRREEGNDDLRLTSFLAEISLATDQDEESKENGGPKVTLMTVHAAKGLEFKNVIIVGVEEELFPASMSCGWPAVYASLLRNPGAHK